jgi:hypothetical protein
MNALTAAPTAECPFLQPARPAPGTVGVAIYCRLPSGSVHVPTLADARRFCLTGRWRACPVYETHAYEAHAQAG